MNVELAKKRARKILSMIGSHIRSASLTVKEPLVYTWDDVADSLVQRGQASEADELVSMQKQKILQVSNV